MEILNNQPMLSYTRAETVRADHTTIITLVAHDIAILMVMVRGGGTLELELEEDTSGKGATKPAGNAIGGAYVKSKRKG